MTVTQQMQVHQFEWTQAWPRAGEERQIQLLCVVLLHCRFPSQSWLASLLRPRNSKGTDKHIQTHPDTYVDKYIRTHTYNTYKRKQYRSGELARGSKRLPERGAHRAELVKQLLADLLGFFILECRRLGFGIGEVCHEQRFIFKTTSPTRMCPIAS